MNKRETVQALMDAVQKGDFANTKSPKVWNLCLRPQVVCIDDKFLH